MINRRILLASHPTAAPTADNFRLVEAPMPAPGAGEFLVRNHFLSLDPYMRGRIGTQKSYAKGVEVDELMVGGTAGEVIASNHPKFPVGARVAGSLGWQEYGVSDGTGMRRVTPPAGVPLSVYLGTLGMPGVTAWVGLVDIAQPKAGETVVVSAASGAVGSVVGQIAKISGCRAVGIAGGRAKCDYVVNELGFDACVDYKAGRLAEDLRAACPDGVDVYFDNVGGVVLDTVLARMNPFSRLPLCGTISDYNATPETAYGVKNYRSILVNRIRVQGFIVSDRMALWGPALQALEGWFAAGRLRYRESVAQGLDAAPAAFIGMLRGENFGKQIVRLIP